MRYTNKIFIVLVLVLSLCADITMTSHAIENMPKTLPSANEEIMPEAPSEDTSQDQTPPGDTLQEQTPAEDTSQEQAPSENDSSADYPAEDNEDFDNLPPERLPADSTIPDETNPDTPSSPDEVSPVEMTPNSTAPESDALDAEENLSEETASVTISAAGDCTLGIDSRYSRNFNKYYKKKGKNYFFKKVRPVFSQDDITIVNFEGTLTTSKKRAKKPFTFKGPKKYASILKNGSVEVVNLANNHTKDFGKRSLTDTRKTMQKNKIGYCRNTDISYQTANGVKTAFLGFNALDKVTKKQIKAGITRAQNNKAEIIVVSFHWGVERKYYPNSKQKSLGHYAIDCGASFVLGHHPHVLQGIEQYKGRYIVYSLGNFCFGGNSNPKDKDTMIFQQTFFVKGGKLQPENKAKIIPCSLSSHKKTNDFQPRILSGKEKKKLIKKMNKLSKKLKVSIASNGYIN